MKKIFSLTTFSTLAILAAYGLIASPAHAANASSGFNVTTNLTAVCAVQTAAVALDFGVYTAFTGPANATPTTSVTFKCTKGTTISAAAFDTGSGLGVVQGLAYSMTVGAASTAAGAAATSTVGAGADIVTYVVTGSMATGQPGAGSGAGSSPRTLIITY